MKNPWFVQNTHYHDFLQHIAKELDRVREKHISFITQPSRLRYRLKEGEKEAFLELEKEFGFKFPIIKPDMISYFDRYGYRKMPFPFILLNSKNRIDQISLIGLGLEQIPDQVHEFPYLESINLSHNKFHTFPDFSQFPNLIYITLDSNSIKEISCLSLPKKLISLSVSDNLIEHIPLCLYKFSNLVGLYLSNNKISEIDRGIINLTKLRSLNLSSNNISFIPSFFRNLPSPRYFSIENNPMVELDEEFHEATLKSKCLIYYFYPYQP